MNAKKLSVAVGAAALVGLGSFAQAGVPVQRSCPSGTVQKVVLGETVGCHKPDGTLAAGPMVLLYPSGKKMAEGQVDERGFRTGTWTLFSEQGVKTHVIQFAGGSFDGKWMELHPNGQPKKVEMYARGVKVGEAQQFDPTGKPLVAR